MPTRLWDVRDQLVTIFEAALADPKVAVYSGPLPPKTTAPKQYVLVGSDGGDTGSGEGSDVGMTAEQDFADISRTGRRNERGEIQCAVVRWHGDASFVKLRVETDATLGALEAALVADAKLGAVLAPSGWARFSRLAIRETQTDAGARIIAVFTVSYEARLT